MKKVLITGSNSYIGSSFEKYIRESFPDDYCVFALDMLDQSWRNISFSGYDVVYHVAGIAHRKETKENADLYYKVNRDLAVEVAKKAKKDGVKQFILLSTMSVYGIDTGIINSETMPKPKTNYGKSKKEAEDQIVLLRDAFFKVCILRLPMVYGDGCKGNYQTLVKLVKKFRVFPRINNQRTLIKIETQVEFVRKAIENGFDGLFIPRDENNVRTVDLIRDIATAIPKKIYFSYLLGFAVLLLRPFVKKLRKAFGTFIYVE